MKKLSLTIAIALGTTFGAVAQEGEWWGNNGGLFQKGESPKPTELAHWTDNLAFEWSLRNGGMMPGLPTHNQDGNQDAPLGSGIAVLVGLGAAYLVGKRRKED